MAKKKVHNAADPVAVMDAEQKNKNVRDQELLDIKEIISRPEGMRFFTRLMVKGSIFCTTMTGNSWSYFKEGGRALVLDFFGDIVEAAPGKVAELMVKSSSEGKEEDE